MCVSRDYCNKLRQPGDLGVLREVFHGFSEEARTRGFPSPSFGGFGFSLLPPKRITYGQVVQSVNLIWDFFPAAKNVPFG